MSCYNMASYIIGDTASKPMGQHGHLYNRRHSEQYNMAIYIIGDTASKPMGLIGLIQQIQGCLMST